MNVHQKQVKHAFVYVPEGTTEVLNAAVVDAKSSYRTPSPMMREAPQIPNVPSTDRIYDNNHYKRDTVRNPEPPAVFIVESNAPICIEAPPQVLETGGSPGNNNPAVLRYDPSGLRSTMSATQSALDESLQAHAPDHQPTPLWAKDADKIIEDLESKGLPMTAGNPIRWRVEPHENKNHSW